MLIRERGKELRMVMSASRTVSYEHAMTAYREPRFHKSSLTMPASLLFLVSKPSESEGAWNATWDW